MTIVVTSLTQVDMNSLTSDNIDIIVLNMDLERVDAGNVCQGRTQGWLLPKKIIFLHLNAHYGNFHHRRFPCSMR